MNRKTIGLLGIVMGSLLTGCGEWKNTSLSNKYSPMKSGESFVFSGTCYIRYSALASCDDVRFYAANDQFESVTRQFCRVERAPNGDSFTEVSYILKPYPLKPEIAYGTKYISFQCHPAIFALVDDWFPISADFKGSVTITPASTAESMIILVPGQQQQLTVTPPELSEYSKYSIGSKFTIIESQQYISFVGNESSCTSVNHDSCSVTVKANSNITTTVNQTLQVITSEYPTELVFIKIVPNTPPTPPTPISKYIFVSQAITAGDFGSLAAADTICNGDVARTTYPTQLGSGTFKALLNGNNATSIGTEYKNLADEVITTATTTNLVAEDTGLTNPIGKTPSGTQDGQYAWTGLARTGAPASDCVNWTTNLNTSSGTAGYVSLNTAAWSVATAGASTCDAAVHLYCVQQ